ncbi:MAG: family 20 glycosylhydrolase [Bacteroidetes bacterium]|nr:family 20 glycosylhydrolase [Bacteroidota bacterium]
MRRILLFALFFIIASSFQAENLPDSNLISIVPKPAMMKTGAGKFIINPSTLVLVKGNDEEVMRIAKFFADRIRYSGGPLLQAREFAKEDKNLPAIIFDRQLNRLSLPDEGYELKIAPKQVSIVAKTGAGLFHAVQTLFQLLPSEISGNNLPSTYKELALPVVKITDYPRYSYRGMHLDVCRHFFPKEFIKRYIDLIAMYKMNTFHWHLTDDQGWRIEIKKYPKLTEIGAWRVDHEDMPWNERPLQQPGEKATYGGFYTQDEIREIVQYAADRYITVIPEIEMPAHCVAALAAYPKLSCSGGPFTVPPGSYWPNVDIFCAGNDSVFAFLEDVLSEVMDLFPSKYIHIGGDEADKSEWLKCPKCQNRIKTERLKDEKELQSYFIKRIEKYIVSKNRKMIGWDEILEGGIAPEATVMSWRGVEGGIAAARQGHDAIMTPGSHCYFDHYQADPAFEPKAIGGFTTLKKVYSFEPTPAELTPAEAKHILGAQGNLWTEFISTPSHVEYMAVPRMIALAEVTWSPKKLRNWKDFQKRMQKQYIRLQRMKVNFSKGSFRVDVSTTFNPKTQTVNLILGSEQLNVPIHYTLDGNDVTPKSPVYTEAVNVKSNGVIRAGLFEDGKLREKAVEMPLIYHHAIGKPVKYLSEFSYRYPASGDEAMTDGLRGTVNHRDGFWHGYQGNNVDLIIDLGKVMPVNSVQTNFLQNQKSWIFLPEVVEYSLSSDGKKYHSFNEVLNKISQKEEQAIIQPFNFQFMENTKARYIRVKAKNPGKCPAWHEGAGEPSWIFIDEVVVF